MKMIVTGVTQMMEILDKYGGWPVVAGDWNSEKWDWMDTYKKISSDGICDAIILNFDIVIDAKNSSKRVIAVRFYKCHESLGRCYYVYYTTILYHHLSV